MMVQTERTHVDALPRWKSSRGHSAKPEGRYHASGRKRCRRRAGTPADEWSLDFGILRSGDVRVSDGRIPGRGNRPGRAQFESSGGFLLAPEVLARTNGRSHQLNGALE